MPERIFIVLVRFMFSILLLDLLIFAIVVCTILLSIAGLVINPVFVTGQREGSIIPEVRHLFYLAVIFEIVRIQR